MILSPERFKGDKIMFLIQDMISRINENEIEARDGAHPLLSLLVVLDK